MTVGKRKTGSKVHMAIDTLSQMLALHVVPAVVWCGSTTRRVAVGK